MTETTATATTPKAKLSRATLRSQGRKKRKLKLQADKEFAKTYFAGKSKRSNDKKAAFRKKKARKK
jgi:hypothetical protein